MEEHEAALTALRSDVQMLRELHDDTFVAHGCEDHIWITALKLIAAGAPNAAQIAALALETRDIEFERGYSPNPPPRSDQ